MRRFNRKGEMPEPKVLIIAIAILIIFAPVAFVLLMNPSPNYVNPPSSLVGNSYMVFQSGGTTYAQNGRTGVLDYSGDASTVINGAVSGTPDGGLITVQTGNYLLSSPISITHPITLQGSGNANGTQFSVSTAVEAFHVDISQAIYNIGATFKNFMVDGGNEVGTVGMNVTSMVRGSISNIAILNFGISGLCLWTCHSITVISCQFQACGTDSINGTGVFINGSNACSFINCDFEYDGTGCKITTGSVNTFLNCVFEGEWYYGIWGHYLAQQVDLTNCWFEQNNCSVLARPGHPTTTEPIYDVWTDHNYVGNWNIQDCQFVGSRVSFAIYANGTPTYLSNDRRYDALFHWGTLAFYGQVNNIPLLNFDNDSKIRVSPYMVPALSGTSYATGVGTILANHSSVIIAHGLSGIPKAVVLTGGSTHYWLTDPRNLVNATSFTVWAVNGTGLVNMNYLWGSQQFQWVAYL